MVPLQSVAIPETALIVDSLLLCHYKPIIIQLVHVSFPVLLFWARVQPVHRHQLLGHSRSHVECRKLPGSCAAPAPISKYTDQRSFALLQCYVAPSPVVENFAPAVSWNISHLQNPTRVLHLTLCAQRLRQLGTQHQYG